MNLRRFIASEAGKWTIRGIAIVVLALCALLLVPAKRDNSIQFPAVAIDQIAMTDDDRHITSNVTDPDKIQKIVAFVNSHTSDWRKPAETFPTPRYSLIFESKGNPQFIVWIGQDGANWIGSPGGLATSADKSLKDISSAERAQLLQYLSS